MLDQRLRPHKARALAPLTERLAGRSPAAVTLGGLAVGLVAAGAAARGWWELALAAWLVNRLADGLDGEVARLSGRASDRGGYLDLVVDSAVYGLLALGVAAGVSDGGSTPWIVAGILLATFYVNIVSVTMLAAILEKRSAAAAVRGAPTTTVLPPGLVEGTETIAFFTIVLMAPDAAVWLMGAMAAAVALTAVLRTVSAWRVLGPETDGPRVGTSR